MSSYDPDMKPIKTAIVGYGKSAKVFHLPYLAFMPQFEIVAFVSSQKESIKKDSTIKLVKLNKLLTFFDNDNTKKALKELPRF